MRRFAIVLPYGCWGTIIPKYVIDVYGSSEKVWVVYLTSLCTTTIGAPLLGVYLSPRLYRRGFRWEWWSMASVMIFIPSVDGISHSELEFTRDDDLLDGVNHLTEVLIRMVKGALVP